MTYNRQMLDSEGTFSSEQTSRRECHRCKVAGSVTFQLWESNDGAYEDEKYTCRNCGAVWWVEGPDA